jgi:hypothetical protein
VSRSCGKTREGPPRRAFSYVDTPLGDDEYLGQAVQSVEFELTADADYDPESGELSNWEVSWIGPRREA